MTNRSFRFARRNPQEARSFRVKARHRKYLHLVLLVQVQPCRKLLLRRHNQLRPRLVTPLLEKSLYKRRRRRKRRKRRRRRKHRKRRMTWAGRRRDRERRVCRADVWRLRWARQVLRVDPRAQEDPHLTVAFPFMTPPSQPLNAPWTTKMLRLSPL